jgi:TonB family protein
VLARQLPINKVSKRFASTLEGFMSRIWPWFLIFALALPAVSTASVQTPSPRPRQAVLVEREHQAWKTPKRASEFSDIPHVSARSRCEDTQPPQALTTPDPLLVPAGAGMKVKVSFIVGSDGRVHSPLILQSAGPVGDRNVLRTVRTWRYRPATCNGVPTEAEGKIEFSRR